jgi:hypothetical protein
MLGSARLSGAGDRAAPSIKVSETRLELNLKVGRLRRTCRTQSSFNEEHHQSQPRKAEVPAKG